MDRFISEFKVDDPEKRKKLLSRKNIIIILLLLVLLNLAYLDLTLLKGKSASQLATDSNNTCSASCVSKINEISNPAKVEIEVSMTPTPTRVPSSTTSGGSAVKEYYVPFGSGSGTSSDWKDVSGLQAYVDSTSYPSIRKVTFETSAHIPNGNQVATVRLYNATDNHPVWNSELTFNGNTSSLLLISLPLTLDPGDKLYKVQMKTQLQYSAIIDQSRLHIITN